MNKNYIGISIGPIIETLLSARKTRELWGASYLFSYLIRNIIREITADKVTVDGKGQPVDNTNKVDGYILLPFDEKISEENVLGAGLYPDRIIIESENSENLQRIRNAINKVIKDVAAKIHGHINTFEKDDIETFLFSYLRIVSSAFPIQPGGNIVNEATAILDVLELEARINPLEDITDESGLNPLRIFFDRVNGSFLYRDGFSENYNKIIRLPETARKLVNEKPRQGFDSLIEIASRELKIINPEKYREHFENHITRELSGKKEDNEENRLVEGLKKAFKDEFMQYHKYVAIVHADGDRIGQIIKKAGTIEKNNDRSNSMVRRFSEKMLEFAQKASVLILDHGGAPVYCGGDDLLFFAPVVFRNEKNAAKITIFNLIDELDKEFGSIFQFAKEIGIEEKKLPSLTYGISLSYYKFPLYEAKITSYDAMHYLKYEIDQRNSLKIDFRKHSGQCINFIIDKNNRDLLKMMRSFFNKINDEKFLNSFTYKLILLKDVISHISPYHDKVENFFRNNFNENYAANKNFFEELTMIINSLPENGRITSQKMDLLYGILRFTHFIRSKDKD